MPEPDGPSRAVREPSGHLDRHLVQGDEITELLRCVLDDDSHQTASSVLSRSPAICERRDGTGVPPTDKVHGAQRHQRDDREDERGRIGARDVEDFELLLDEERQRLGLAGDPARDDRDRAELAEGASRGKHDAVGQAPPDSRQRDPPERLPAARAQRRRRLLLVRRRSPAERARSRARRTAATRRWLRCAMPIGVKITRIPCSISHWPEHAVDRSP